MKKIVQKRQEGATLLELLLTLGVIGLIMVMGMGMYQSFQNITYLRQLMFNVDQLFEATSNYYKANCAAGDFSPRPPVFLSPYPVNAGTLAYPPAATRYFPVSIVSTLVGNRYLENWAPANPLVDPSSGESGYVVQLNPIVTSTSLPVNACTVTAVGQACLPITTANIASPTRAYSGAPSSTIAGTQAVVVTWAVQVAVKIAQPSKIAAYAATLGADCMSNSSSSGTVDPCAVGNSSHQYLVFARLPAVALRRNSLFSTSMQMLKQYNLLYSHDRNYEFNAGYSTTTSPAQAPVYYLCGG